MVGALGGQLAQVVYPSSLWFPAALCSMPCHRLSHSGAAAPGAAEPGNRGQSRANCISVCLLCFL